MIGAPDPLWECKSADCQGSLHPVRAEHSLLCICCLGIKIGPIPYADVFPVGSAVVPLSSRPELEVSKSRVSKPDLD